MRTRKPNPVETARQAILFMADGTTVRKYSEWGSYPVFYVTADNTVLSADAVQDNLKQCRDPDDPQWYVVAHDANWENPDLYCDHTGERIESAYADDD